MSDLELLLACLMIPAAYVIIYIAGKYDMVTMICKMLESKCKKIAAQAEKETVANDLEETISRLKSIQKLYREDSTGYKALEIAIEKLAQENQRVIEKLEELYIAAINTHSHCPNLPESEECIYEYSCASCYIQKAINIVKDSFKN